MLSYSCLLIWFKNILPGKRYKNGKYITRNRIVEKGKRYIILNEGNSFIESKIVRMTGCYEKGGVEFVKSKKEIVLRCKNISKNFGPTQALKSVDFEVEKGTVHGLIGENGSGKSTLTSVFAGIYKPDGGEMTFLGEEWKPDNALWAEEHGIRIVVQESGTIDSMTVAENLFLGKESQFRKGILINKAAMQREAQKALDAIGVTDLTASVRTSSLDMQERKLVEIAKAVYGDVKLLVVDETTTALSGEGRKLLYQVIRRLADNGASILLITHDVAELMEQCDRTTVLRDGELVGTVEKEEFNEAIIRQMMIGREINGNYYRNDNDGYEDEVVLKAENITTSKTLMNFSLELHKGEILGIGGLSHCGMHILGKALYGEELILNGKVTLPQKQVTITSTMVAVKNGVGYISKERDAESLSIHAPIYENISSTGYELNKVWKIFVSKKKERAYVNRQIEKFSIKCQSPDQEVNNLSGGNKQKVAFGKWVACDADILIMDCPTRGVDIGVKATMYQLISEMKKQGKSIVLISEELPELIGMSDRILILKDGIKTGEFLRTNGLTEQKIINYMI